MSDNQYIPQKIERAIDMAIERDSGPKNGVIGSYTAMCILYNELHWTQNKSWTRKCISIGMKKRGYVRYSRGSKTYGPHFYKPKES